MKYLRIFLLNPYLQLIETLSKQHSIEKSVNLHTNRISTGFYGIFIDLYAIITDEFPQYVLLNSAKFTKSVHKLLDILCI